MGKGFEAKNERIGGLERDIDFHNQRLWKKKKYRDQKAKDDKKKHFSAYKKIAATEMEESEKHIDEKQRSFYENLFTKTEEEKTAPIKGDKATSGKTPIGQKVREKKKKAAKATPGQTGKATPGQAVAAAETGEKAEVADKVRAPKQGKNATQGFKQKFEKMKQQKNTEEEAKEKLKRQFEKKLKVKARYSKQLTRRNKNGQMIMSGMISHLLTKITKNQ